MVSAPVPKLTLNDNWLVWAVVTLVACLSSRVIRLSPSLALSVTLGRALGGVPVLLAPQRNENIPAIITVRIEMDTSISMRLKPWSSFFRSNLNLKHGLLMS